MPDNFRITDTRTDSRVATCYQIENAKMVCAALNVYAHLALTVAKPDG